MNKGKEDSIAINSHQVDHPRSRSFNGGSGENSRRIRRAEKRDDTESNLGKYSLAINDDSKNLKVNSVRRKSMKGKLI